MERWLCEHYGRATLAELSRRLGVSPAAVFNKAALMRKEGWDIPVLHCGSRRQGRKAPVVPRERKAVPKKCEACCLNAEGHCLYDMMFRRGDCGNLRYTKREARWPKEELRIW